MQLRPAVPADMATVADIWHAAWHVAHAGHVPDGLTAARTLEAFHERTPARVDDTVVAVVDGAVVGFTMVDGDEVEQVFVDPAHHGGGVAAPLLAAVEQQVADAGYDVAWLAVVVGNARARRFYEKHGWYDEGDLPYEVTALGQQFISPCRRYEKRLVVSTA
ncbi:GNAT family N-acetyltransferase [Nocardioides mangrovi]|uniref:GNAT family N-acetyltransferase n=1 Tax=Nocardioides mangrovi TaxID=2874580 RepID=A0ABS7UJF1_9ACTN|nr:GNAT family N-acetyltransferase [Nocardioides mangrovi]MBZ5741160.1 GNAT family N-acetyltransferase [Nocardioides mangrovi]